MIITEYRNVNAVKSARVKDYTWTDFCKKISHPAVMTGTTWEGFKALPENYTRDAKGQVIDYEEETQFSIKTKGGGAVFGEMVLSENAPENGRTRLHFPNRSAVVFDYEHCGTDIFERIKNGLKDITYCYHTTCKFRPPEDVRLHVIIPFEKAVDFRLYYIIYIEIARKIGLQGLDLSSMRREQMELYCVQLRGNKYEHFIHNVKGDDGSIKFLNVENSLMQLYGSLDCIELTKKLGINWREYPIRKDSTYFYNKEVKEIPREKKPRSVKADSNCEFEFNPKPARAGDIKSCFNAVISCRDILDDLRNVYIPCGERYMFYKSGSRIPAVWVNDEGTKCGSYHADSGDPLFDKNVTAFDAFLLLFCENCKGFKEKIKKAHDYAMRKKGKDYEKLYYAVKIW